MKKGLNCSPRGDIDRCYRRCRPVLTAFSAIAVGPVTVCIADRHADREKKSGSIDQVDFDLEIGADDYIASSSPFREACGIRAVRTINNPTADIIPLRMLRDISMKSAAARNGHARLKRILPAEEIQATGIPWLKERVMTATQLCRPHPRLRLI